LFNYHYKIINEININYDIIDIDVIDNIITLNEIQGLFGVYNVQLLVSKSDDIMNDYNFISPEDSMKD